MSEKFVFHGSPREFNTETANPRLNKRINVEGEVIFNEESFHATPHKWIALAYTYTSNPVNISGVETFYNIGVDLYSNKKMITIFGIDSLEDSLDKLYGAGGYVYYFNSGDFIHKEGLGNQEVIATFPTKPLYMETVNNPVKEMVNMGVSFYFVDLSLPKTSNNS